MPIGKKEEVVYDAIEELEPAHHDDIVKRTGMEEDAVREAVMRLVDYGYVGSTMDWKYRTKREFDN